MEWITRAADKAGALGSIVSAAGAGLFSGRSRPRRRSGPWRLQRVRGPVSHHLAAAVCRRCADRQCVGLVASPPVAPKLAGMIGPAMVLAAMLLFFGHWWTADLLYTGLAFMVGVSLWDLLSPRAQALRHRGLRDRTGATSRPSEGSAPRFSTRCSYVRTAATARADACRRLPVLLNAGAARPCCARSPAIAACSARSAR